MIDFNETNLILKAKSGDRQALETLISQNLDQVVQICLLYMKNEFDAQDAAQETFVKIWKNLDRFDTDRSFKNWIHEIAKNTCFDFLKKKRVIPASALSETEQFDFHNQFSDEPSPHELAERSSIKNWLLPHLKKLSRPYQQILKMYYEQGLNFREISEQLQEPIDTIKSRHRRAILELRKTFSN